MSNLYEFTAKSLQGEEVPLKNFAGKVSLVVNTASKCGFTPQYDGLEKLYKKYADQGFVVLGFPCNQFGWQEPGNAEEISAFCKKNYGVSFPMFEKIDVNGSNTHPIYKFLKNEKKGILGTTSIKWNFTKFLVDRNGKVVERYGSSTKPEEIEEAIKALLANNNNNNNNNNQ